MSRDSAPAANPGRFAGQCGTRGSKLLALLFFLLPWVTVSCADQTLVSMSGLDLATGSVTTHNPLTGETTDSARRRRSRLPVLVGGAA